MLRLRTLKILVAILGLYGLLLLPAVFWPSYLDSPAGLLALGPFLSVYFFHHLGIPGLLEQNGACGWGWCSPTPVGWVFIVAFWLVLAWLIAWAVAALTSRRRAQDSSGAGTSPF